MPDPRLNKRYLQIVGELQRAERELNNINSRFAMAKQEMNSLINAVVNAANQEMGWKEFKQIARQQRVALQVVAHSAGVFEARWKDFLMLTDQDVRKDPAEQRNYKVPLENLELSPARPQNPAPMGHMVFPPNRG